MKDIINQTVNEIEEGIIKELEDGLMTEVRIVLGYNIDKRALIEAINKATPKKPIWDELSVINLCPTCRKNTITPVYAMLGKKVAHYCFNCGQKLDVMDKGEEVEE